MTWNALASDLSIDHPATVADYVRLLESMDVLFVLHALREDRLGPAPKKARKVWFSDPFIHHAVRFWLEGGGEFETVVRGLDDPERASPLAEAMAAAHFRRHFPCFYIKGTGEVDIAYVRDGRSWPVEVKWTGQVRPKSLAELSRRPGAAVLARTGHGGRVAGIPVTHLPLALLRLPLPPGTAAVPQGPSGSPRLSRRASPGSSKG